MNHEVREHGLFIVMWSERIGKLDPAPFRFSRSAKRRGLYFISTGKCPVFPAEEDQVFISAVDRSWSPGQDPVRFYLANEGFA